jgi:hypothetical protein
MTDWSAIVVDIVSGALQPTVDGGCRLDLGLIAVPCRSGATLRQEPPDPLDEEKLLDNPEIVDRLEAAMGKVSKPWLARSCP